MMSPIRVRGPIILCLISFVFFASSVLGWSDNFASYGNEYIVFETGTSDGWNVASDASSIATSSLLKNDGPAMRVNIDPLKSTANEAVIHKKITPINASAYWSQGRLFFWFDPSLAIGLTTIKVRIGNGTKDYWEYKTDNPNLIGFVDGAQLVAFDLNEPTYTVGSPNPSLTEFLQIMIGYSAATPLSSFEINRVWLEKAPNSTKGSWNRANVGGKIGGSMLPYSSSSLGNGMSITYNGLPSLGEHGRIFPSAITDELHTNFTVNATTSVVKTNWGTRLLFDYIDGFNFGAIYITPTWDEVGVEYWQNGVRKNKEVHFDVKLNTFYDIKYVVVNKTVNVYVNGVKKITYTLPNRKAGEIGVEAYKGTSRLKYFSFEKQ